MSYCDYEYYTEQYFGNVIKNEQDFKRLAKRASDKIDSFTFGNLTVSEGTIKYTWDNCREFHVEELPERTQEKVKEACCALAEKMADIEIANQTIRDAGGAGIQSVSSGSESIHFGNSGALVSEEEQTKAYYAVVREYLTGTGLLYAGI